MYRLSQFSDIRKYAVGLVIIKVAFQLISSLFYLLVFRQRVLNKLFPCDEESQSDSEDNETQRNLEKESTTRTEDEALYEVPYKGQKRKRSENDGRLSNSFPG